MRKLIGFIILSVLPVIGYSAGGGNVHLEQANYDLTDQASLQRGAKYFVNYCMGCHSAKYVRYESVANHAGLTEDEVKNNLMFDESKKIGQQMVSAMAPNDASRWFGTAIPDLTLTARLKHGGGDWIYTYLKSFYVDDSRPTGVNNIVFPDVGMPHVLVDLQGLQKANFKIETDADGNEHKIFEGFEQIEAGAMSSEEYDSMVRDLTNFMVWASEPMKLERQRLGYWVIGFLVILFVLAYLLKKEYWKDIH
ncbi:MAG: cytochrome c1 [Gammaproteobacteria bacterium]|jgi:ubiquinol-cytochrome c reductase cytochrome c1 subunit